MDNPTRIVVVEDEDDIRNLMVFNLRRAGFEVVAAGDGATGLAMVREHRPTVVLLDLMLPDMTGNEVCALVRADPQVSGTYIVMVTARSEEQDRIEGFEVGADDYVTKPFSVRELVLRVKAAARRSQTQLVVDDPTDLVAGPLCIEQAAHRVLVEGEEMDLTATEYKLLVYLVRRAGKLCSRGELLEQVWELPPTLNTRTVDTHVKRLRQKLDRIADMVETVRGAGYRFQAEES